MTCKNNYGESGRPTAAQAPRGFAVRGREVGGGGGEGGA